VGHVRCPGDSRRLEVGQAIVGPESAMRGEARAVVGP
jgi:hypothetical protein